MKKLLFIVPFVLGMGTFVGCEPAVDDGAEAPVEVIQSNPVKTVSPYGVYEGLIPAADGPGINIKITLNKNRLAEMDVTYIDHEGETFKEEGSFVIDGDILKLIIGGEVHYYKIGPATLTMLTPDQKEIQSTVAHMYILRQMKAF